MSPITAPDDHCPVKHAQSIETKESDDYSDSKIDDIEGLNSEAVMLFRDIYKDHVIDPSYKPEFMEMDGTYAHNIEIPLTFTNGAEPESIYNVNEYNRKGPVDTINTLNHLKDPLKACVVAGVLNRELISQLKFHSNKYAHGKIDHSDGMFVGYKWFFNSIAEMHRFLGILLKMSLISSDVDGLKSLWYLLTCATISPTCQFEIKDYPCWNKRYDLF